jgi:hypothetical protein
VLRESDGTFSVHPAVRDHFYQLATTTEQGAWHDLIRERLVTLVHQPGRSLPEDAATLDLAEEAIYHAMQAGRSEEAVALYQHTLGGVRHLAWKLGEMARGLRILRGFNPCPDRWALGWHLRALGELDAAFVENDLPFFRADIRLLQGRLPQVAAVGDSVRSAIAAFLMGHSQQLPASILGCAIPRQQILLYLGLLRHVDRSAAFEDFYHEIGWEGDRARCRLLLAESARRQKDTTLCRSHLEAASVWILHSGSVEHLCLWHLVRSRAARQTQDSETAQRAVDEGLHIARQSGLGLYHVELLCEQAEVCLARADLPAAEQVAGAALERATAAECQFAWGAAEAGHLLGQALLLQNRKHEARAILNKTCDTRRRIGDPRVEHTEQLLEKT